MAHQIDQLFLWLFASLSAFFLMIVLTNGNIPLSMLCAFAVTLLLRQMLQKFIPEKKWITRKKQIQQIENLLYQCAITDEMSALNTICKLLPNLFFDVDRSDIIPILRLPDGPDFSCTDLLDLWHKLKRDKPSQEHILIFMTCALSEDAKDLLKCLTSPHIQIADKNKIIRQLLKESYRIPAESVHTEKREPCKSFYNRMALFIRNIHPLRTGMYLCFFIGMYLLNRSLLHLLSAAACTMLLFAHILASRRRYTL